MLLWETKFKKENKDQLTKHRYWGWDIPIEIMQPNQIINEMKYKFIWFKNWLSLLP